MPHGTLASSPAPIHVFVYGTLRRGGSNDINRLSPAPQWIDRAEVAGTMYDFGPYPGVVLGGDGRVLGEVYAIAPELLPVLDEIEEVYPQRSDEYLRRELGVRAGGQERRCVVYEINARYVHAKPVIASGDWLAHVEA